MSNQHEFNELIKMKVVYLTFSKNNSTGYMVNIFTCLKYSLLFLLTAFLLISCSRSDKSASKAVAIIEDRVITSDEFAFAYELAPRNITQLGKEKAYSILLDGMIDRVLFAKEGKRRDLDKDSILQRAVDYFERAAVVRELYLKHIRDSVKVSDDEMRSAYKKSKTTLYLKNFLATNRDDAEKISKGLLTISHTPLLSGLKSIETEKFGALDIISWNDVKQEIEDIVFNLPLHKRSRPYFDGKFYHTFEVVEKEINAMTTENDYYANKPAMESAIRKRKEHKKAFEFVQRTMKPQHLIIKAESLNELTFKIWKIHNHDENAIDQYLDNKEIQSLSEKNKNLLNQNLADFKYGTLTVSDFIFTYKMNPYQLSFKSKQSIRENLKNMIAIYVRDFVFSEQGMKEGLDKKPSVKKEVRNCEERLLANKLKRNLYEQLAQSISDSTKLIEEYNLTLKNFAQELRAKSKVHIDKNVMKEIKTTDEGLPRKIDFFAIRVQ
ncbi:MAG: hypothetical protein DRP89_02450 [Candidatus Neomarinimicrobiota bacterium]|nr:MAG: hypothetical protein DRP89_02450 [Candidatus Neomarinimicrobiota bacterium]